MKKRREFYKEEIDSGRIGENGIQEERERIIYSADEQISLVLELSSDGNAPYSTSGRSSRQPRLEAADRRYLSCPGNFTVGHLKKFIRMKFNLCEKFQVDFYHTDQTLYDHYSLVDIAYIYSWRRKGPLRLYYTVYSHPAKRHQQENEEIVPMETDLADVTNNSDLKTETSGYISDDDKFVSENEKSISHETDDGERNDSLLDDIVKDSNVVSIGNIEIKETNDILEKHSNKVKECNPIKSCSTETHVTKEDIEKIEDTQVVNKCNNDDSFDSDREILVQSKHDKNDEKLDKTDERELQNVSQMDYSKREHDTDRGEICASKGFKREKPEMVEASTATHSVSSCSDKCNVQTPKQSKSSITDEDISEPVVSSTQNTQGCQTEPPESNSESVNRPHSSDIECIASSVSPSCKSTVDVSCETDNFVLSRSMSVDSVSVSTETEDGSSKPRKRKLVDCSTDVCDFPKSQSTKKLTVDCSTDFEDFPSENMKDNALTVDCSTNIDNYYPSSNKRKSIENDSCDESAKGMKKSDIKSVKRSYSYTSHLTSTKPAYLSQPLSPTKLTLKFTAPKSPAKSPNSSAPKSPSRAWTTGFQSKYQSFVMDEKTYSFDDNESPKSSKTSPTHEPNGKLVISVPQTLPATQKKPVSSKTGRPRGRPPKNRSLDYLPPPKEKKHKSRSHSPKHRKHYEKDKERDSCVDKLKISKSQSGTSKSHTAYSWINKLEGDSKVSTDKKGQKVKEVSAKDKASSDLRIPKQFLYFSNGQYTIATVSSLNSLKQSSPVSPPPKTVFTAEVNAKNKTKVAESEIKKSKITSNETTCNDIKTDTAQNVNKMAKPIENANENRTSESNTESKPSPKTDSNQNTIERTSTAKSSDSSKNENGMMQSDGLKKDHDKSKDHVTDTTTPTLPEYRHQSPFFASISNAKLQAPHRAAAHLNVPNISSHFSGTHHLYSQGRYSNDRIAPSMYRSLSVNDKLPASTLASKLEEARRLEAIASVSHSYLSQFPAPYLGLMHSHLVSSLPPPPPLSKQGHMPEHTRSLSFSDSSPSINFATPNSSKFSNKAGNTTPKGKEKSIDRIISAITERKTKKESQEQINGIDLSTKSSRNIDKMSESDGVQKADKFEFTDDDDAPVSHKKVIGGKVENPFDVRKEKV
ncbi:RAWUL domain RING finger- and WD40-associated ubiquitin-like [Mactra antiquata]